MFDTAFTFGLTQFARSLSFPERLQNRPFRNAALEPWRWRNTGLDALFYDIKALTAEETFYISDSLAAEGLIMIVPPSGQGMLTLCDSLDEYLLRGGRQVRALAVAGIGGSAIGAAAFARNIANALDAPVAAVVSGYGLGDVVTEAMGGLFFFGPLGFLRNSFEAIDDMVGRPQFGAYHRRMAAMGEPRRASLDADTVEALLGHESLRFDVIATHSKGSRTVSEALSALEKADPARLADRLGHSLIVTFGARAALPAAVPPALAVMGELDWYGEINSSTGAASLTRVALSGHSTNTDVPGALRVTALMREILASRSSTEEVEETVSAAVIDLPVVAAEPVAEVVEPEPVQQDAAQEDAKPAETPEAVVEAEAAPVISQAAEPEPEPVLEAIAAVAEVEPVPAAVDPVVPPVAAAKPVAVPPPAKGRGKPRSPRRRR
ncbi:cell envelope biogenesis protein OmpA [Rhizobium paknamense]|uniref:Cell envelope biogenesis protein OmpA n=1 Tax=Rhizobium paknamense TaxID=1206817 RepID=A0ABU0I8E7_9HYPH|nr:cell envelope biogenesis protein OmpA [Rhizobium paknamense]MDQ0454500.1 hypothetical protein [Rhizobium paknamense]